MLHMNSILPSGKLTELAAASPFSIGNTSSFMVYFLASYVWLILGCGSIVIRMLTVPVVPPAVCLDNFSKMDSKRDWLDKFVASEKGSVKVVFVCRIWWVFEYK